MLHLIVTYLIVCYTLAVFIGFVYMAESSPETRTRTRRTAFLLFLAAPVTVPIGLAYLLALSTFSYKQEK